MFRLKILFDNLTIKEDLKALWGFSALIEIDNIKILFDTGSNGRVLLRNAQKMGVDFQSLDYLFISHPHWDHIGGIDTVWEINNNLTAILPSSLSEHYIANLKDLFKKIIVIDEKSYLIDKGFYSTGIMAEEGEQSLILETNKGLIVITGCGHAGINNILKRSKEIVNDKIFYVAGGFHLLHKREKEILEIQEQIDTQFITPTHCTGSLGIKIFKDNYKDKFLSGGVGSVITFEKVILIPNR